MKGLTHLDETGRARMVDVSAKPTTRREAKARAVLTCQRETVDAVVAGRTPKGAVIATAELAGMMAAKRTAELIPLCHPLPLAKAEVTVRADCDLPGFRIAASVVTTGPTGVEMEALTAATVAGLTVYDMLKAIDRGMVMGEVRVDSKTGGTSGDWQRESGDE
ncbi:cyclic pyranopterin monophosphate synthase MoaC [Qipengyuania sp. XHP0211]|uniref:cyclic pyranopterin monophosphate synthase MoaC n=1 Tax=Qipengyuania sp. XHP0211 TaxID=3038079 RepID=UPI00241FCB6F|nr:cyclic pyranopterin monophosphate synthase MoaC [Qipengyuania sp. XHP0211]MDG5750524.1 cyclic pyranopterin monophosphate synthase MoaC [Qipengyuania sp. XHP0211]